MTNNRLIDRMLKIVDETYVFYVTDPSRRGTDGQGGCFYEAPNGNKCAVGRCMKKSEIGPHLAGDVRSLTDERSDEGIEMPLDSLLTKSRQGLEVSFWQSLQAWHDDDNLWYPNRTYELMKVKWNEPDLDGVHREYVKLRDSVIQGDFCTRA